MKYLEIPIVENCNLNCKYCSHFSPLAGKEELEPDTLEQDLNRLCEIGVKHIDVIRLMGGEPLLHTHISDIIKITRKYYKTSQVCIVTNGILVRKMNEEFWQLCKELNISIKITKYPTSIPYDELKDYILTKDVQCVFSQSHIDYTKEKFHKLVIDEKGGNNKYENFTSLCTCSKCTNLLNGRIYLCPVVTNIRHFNSYFNKSIKVTYNDYFDLYSADSSLDKLKEYLDTPIDFCEYCACHLITYDNNWELSKRDIKEWTI